MLQWMGGSRRKVTTSRKSTQKRQKQYFEQRKRQQQEQEHGSSVIESYAYNKVPSTQCHEKNRSLDILSLLNLSKHGQDCPSRLPEEGRGSPNGKHTTQNYQTTHCPNVIQMEIKNVCPSEHVEIRETALPGVASNHLEETVSPQDRPDASKRNHAKYPMKTTTDYKMSVVDMLGDDGQNSSSRGNFVHENHVSFSVEGLGKVGTETPVHSPQYPTRNFSYKCRAPPKISKGFHSSKNIDCSLDDQFSELDHMAFGVDVPIDGSSLELPPYREEVCRNSKQKTMVGKESLLQGAKDFLSNDEFYDSRVDLDGLKWHEESCFLDDNYCGLSRGNWSCDLDSSILNPTRRRNYDKPDFSFEGLHMQKRRPSENAASFLNVPGLYSPYKRQMEHGYDFMVSDMKHYPTSNDNCEFSEMTHCSAWPSFEKEDARDCLSFLSEDSCLSPAVWHEGTTNPSFNSTARQKTRGPEADFRRPVVNKFSTKKNTFTEEFWQQESGICSRACNRISESSTPGDDWLFEPCNIENVKPGYASLNASETQKSPPFGCKHWAEETFDQDFNPKFYGNEKSSASRSEQDAFSGNLFSDKDGFCKQFSPSHSSHISNSNNVQCGHQESFSGLFKEEKDSHTMQLQESVSTGENRSVTLPAISSTLDQSNYSSSTKETPMDVVDSEDNHSQFEESKVKTPELNPRPNVVPSPLRSDGGSSSVEMPQTLEEYDGFKEHSNGTHTSLMSQNEHEVIDNSGQGKGDLKHEGPHNNVDRSCKVMMLGRFVLQLL